MRTERFEMRLEEDTLARVDRWAEEEGIRSRSEAARRLIETGLLHRSRRSVSLTDGEKLILFMLRDLYKKSDDKAPEIDPDFIADVITGGHYWALDWQMVGLFHGHVDDPNDLTFVVDVLDMWDYIERGYDGLGKADKARVEQEAEPVGKHVKFLGFDGNNEGGLMSMARFLVNDLGRFSRFKGRDLNAHMPTIDTHRRMLPVFEPLRRQLVGTDLNADQIIALLREKLHPDHR